jgi:uncharacterized protein YqgC (DUF456 family)
MEASVLLWIAGGILAAVGFAGLVLPVVPGAPVLFAGLVLAAWADDFSYVGRGWLSVLGGLAVLTYAVDFAASAFGAKRFGASSRAIVGATIGAIVGLFFGLPGVIVGPFVGAVVGELSARRSLGEAGRAGLGATIGLALGAAAKLALGFSMLGIFAVVRFL